MTEKIDWYKEVLELEPNSKVFYPLSRLLAEAGRTDEAVDTLEQGLARHEEFLEARLFLVELLHQLGQDTACTAQLDRLGQVFSAHAGFWRAFAACAATREAAPDTAAALQFLALYFAHGPVPLHLVVERGVASYWAEADQPSTARPTAPAVSSTAKAAAGPSPTASRMSECVPSPTVTPTAAAVAEDISAPVPLEDDSFARFDPDAAMADESELPGLDTLEAAALPSAASAPEAAATDSDAAAPWPPVAPGPTVEQTAGGEEAFSLRTRSMAEVLAEQGDIKGALDIYHELAAAAVDPEEIADLRQRISTLSARLGGGPTASAPAADPAPSAGGKEKLITMLEALAGRVEARAHG
ncbi:tetratricopeptide repeat protein [Desulfovibrio legallii]|uniref:tetratricopeptide repeat protein n=1 Tax=Desulfovibrio legallii TaxID=571438 RepID=UPI000E4B2E02|nr:tetratricopeptide repeat protein [Desulfovibrio legallii]RHH26235.1 tetratricopeptide repeat protein [Desulfovibrio sp. AM18-2]